MEACVLKKTISKEEFMRNLLIEMSKSMLTPANILEAEFSDIEEFEEEFLVVSANVNVSYSASCGYDRKVQYRASDGTTKTKTVTDWSPYSGISSSAEQGFAVNKDKANPVLNSTFRKVFDSFDTDCNTKEIVLMAMRVPWRKRDVKQARSVL